ncbi:Erv26 domain-containing protein [Phanerochaete sordida]|uniref:Erv26 domain-containing protein n=1 Tax=Phanerochaete sordida TaxID=48140 RepID=A0A9P3FXQ1_9APHY|nr:Erv26 domain-containing protein [Phanerochaete sordida]
MSMLHYLSYGGAVAAFIFITLSLASGLLWLSEMIEEHSRSAKVIGQRGIYAIIFIHVLLWYFDSLPLHLTVFSIACHVVYLQNFTPNWPVVSLSSLTFLASCGLVITDHFLWFFYFARVTQNARHRARTTYPRENIAAPGFADIATFFGICVWLAPLFLFLSLSANDNALPMNLSGTASVPSTPAQPSHSIPKPQRTSLFKSFYDSLPLDSLPRMRPRPRRDASQGIIAPPSPRPMPSPLPSPSIPGMRRNASSSSLPPYATPPPPRRVSSDSPGLLAIDSLERVASPEQFSHAFALGEPPKRGASSTLAPSLRRGSMNRAEMRRVQSSSGAYDPDR